MVDPQTGRMHVFGYEFLSPKLTYYAVDPSGTLDVVSPIAVDAASMVHDFDITDRQAVFWLGPVVFDTAGLAGGGFPFAWDPDGPSKVGVMPLDGSGAEIRWLDVPLGYAFHGLNARTDGDDVVLHLHRMEQVFGPKGDLVPSHRTEWRIGTGSTMTLAEQRVSELAMDLPTIDRRHLGRKTRHGWCSTRPSHRARTASS